VLDACAGLTAALSTRVQSGCYLRRPHETDHAVKFR
jgi:hypothetical protein